MIPATVGVAPPSSELGPVVINESVPDVKEIRDICVEVLAHFKTKSSGPIIGHDPVLLDLCYQEVQSRGYPMDDPAMTFLFSSCLPGGIRMASVAYGHIESVQRRIFAAFYTAFIFYVEDRFPDNLGWLSNFNVRFCSGQQQEDIGLDFFANFFRGMYAYFDPLAANIITAAALNFVTAQFLEQRTQNLKLLPSAKRFPKFVRGLSGTAEPYAFMVFPPEVPVDSYIHALPELLVLLNEGNDVLSFYKEEIAGEETNLVSTAARCMGLRKSAVLRDFSKEMIDADKNVTAMLEPESAALKAYNGFAERYIAFHTSHARYRLDELIAGGAKAGDVKADEQK